ncbi:MULTISPECIES: SidA/IucD/PvdA family monooxygenase [unclassified Streptomyces]|uniref:lysine N(6)-hydroxylase/L-ornithine N(5)-oxygenase family protein n=1 Tax=unclassified Streptomyces TaxID=2593676 RepID=UPI00081F61B4|nr:MULTISPECIES: SidA/IucD/PvdA family monooxygenase [unclassified Streptomyces]MYZ40206.1 SidA/IucD/PvdA family monooxygenase [Streptomyces sp. SID4917]SCG06927.1 lysine N6-hydroxylase [Streptomyces sp. MnatMP-M17]
MTNDHGRTDAPYDLLGIGIGPFNLSLAALSDRSTPGLRTLFLDAKPAFSWHPGLLMEGTVLQVPFLADLVTMADPTSPWSYLNYLREHDRMFPFFFSERFHIPRREYDHYCRWVAERLPSCRFDARVTELEWEESEDGGAGGAGEGAGTFAVTYRSADGSLSRVRARQVVLGVGTSPVVPEPLRPLLASPSPAPSEAHAHSGLVLHSADYRTHRTRLARLDDVTVIGAGQSGAEVTLDLLRQQDGNGAGGPYVRWLARTPAFAPMEYSKIGLEHFTPDYIRYFRALPDGRRDQLVREQWQLYKGVSEETLGEIHDELYERTIGGTEPRAALHPGVAVTAARPESDGGAGYVLTCRHTEQDEVFEIRTSAIVSATGYAAARPDFLDTLAKLVVWDEKGRYRIDGQYRVTLDPRVTGTLYVQNAELHTHGVGAPDLTLGAWRAATILNAAAGRVVVRVPERAAWTTFGAPRAPGA